MPNQCRWPYNSKHDRTSVTLPISRQPVQRLSSLASHWYIRLAAGDSDRKRLDIMTSSPLVAPSPWPPAHQSQLLQCQNVSQLLPTLLPIVFVFGGAVGRTVAHRFRLVGLELHPAQIDHLVGEHRNKKDLCDRSAEGLVEGGLWRNNPLVKSVNDACQVAKGRWRSKGTRSYGEGMDVRLGISVCLNRKRAGTAHFQFAAQSQERETVARRA